MRFTVRIIASTARTSRIAGRVACPRRPAGSSDIGFARFHPRQFLLSSGFPSVAFIDEPEDAILAATAFRGMSPRQAIRFSTRCFSSLNEVMLAQDLHLIRGDRYFSPATSVIEELLDVIVGSADPVVVAQVLARFAPDVSTSPLPTVGDLMLRQAPEASPPGRKLKEHPPQDQRLIMAVADAYRPIFNRRDLDLLHWPREMFLFSRDFDAEYKAIELLGGTRYIVYGPYLCLPRGNTVHLRKSRALGDTSRARSLGELVNWRAVLPPGAEVSPPSPGLCGWRRGLRSAIPSKPDLRRRSVGRLRDDPDGFGDVDGRERPIGLAAYRKAAHLAFDAAFVSPIPARRNSLLQDFVEDRAMQRRPGQRGKKRRTSAICGGRPGSRAGTKVDPDPRRR